ncbi:MAG: hypothetical protein IPH07_17435 [Deltaproteobacteria bacterium]|nr:hypothetical protein [Deltaproteobacteria bacterium]
MLKLPAFKHYQFDGGASATVFRDDAKFARFYIIPGFPSVRLDGRGNPVWQLIKYKFSDQSREENPELPRGGGYMVFDAELRTEPEHQAQILEDLQSWVNQEWERLKAIPDPKVRRLKLRAAFNDSIGDVWNSPAMAGGGPMATAGTGTRMSLDIPTGDGDGERFEGDPPKVELGEPLWLEGKVTMNAPESAGLVQNKIGERPASLLGNNVAAFSVDLTPDGATFMQKTLVGDGGGGATDLTPVQVVYSLTMLAKLPRATMYIKFNTSQVYHAAQELFHEHDNCSDDYFTSENIMSTAINAGIVTVKIDMGGVTDPDLQQMLTSQAMSGVQKLLTERFATKERKPLEEWADSGLAESSNEVYRLKRINDVEMTDFEQHVEIEPNVKYTIAPQGTLAAFFRDQRDMTAFVREVDLDDPFFKTLALSVRALARWQEDGVAAVEVEVKYEHDGELKTNTFTFTPAATDPQKWDPALIGKKRDYTWRSRVTFVGRAAGEWSRWETATTRDLNIAVPTPGKLEVAVSGVGIDYENVVDAVLVHLRYQDTARDVPLAGQSILLAADRTSGTWTRMLYADWDKPLEFRVEYLLKTGTVVTRDWAKTDGPVQNLLIGRPDVDVLDVTLVPAGDWSQVVQAAVDVRYADGDYHRDGHFQLKTQEEFKKWGVLMVHADVRKFEYKLLATFKNGDTQESPWMTLEGDQAVPVKVQGPPRLAVKITGATLDVASTPLVRVDVEYPNPVPPGTDTVAAFSLQANTDVHTWSVPVLPDSKLEYRMRVTYFPKEGPPVERPWETSASELVVVPRYSIPLVGAAFNPLLQDFAKTIALEVNLRYDDDARNVHLAQTLQFTGKEKQSWFVPVPDDAPREYTMEITWFYADGTSVSSTPVKLSKPAVILPTAPKATQEPV